MTDPAGGSSKFHKIHLTCMPCSACNVDKDSQRVLSRCQSYADVRLPAALRGWDGLKIKLQAKAGLRMTVIGVFFVLVHRSLWTNSRSPKRERTLTERSRATHAGRRRGQ
jgi:hypothetical protein